MQIALKIFCAFATLQIYLIVIIIPWKKHKDKKVVRFIFHRIEYSFVFNTEEGM